MIVLLHGGWHTRQNWHEVGYVDRLQDRFKVVTIDIRGNGESDKPTDPVSYTTNKMCQDILTVADDCSATQFTVWGFSYGANLGRYLAAQSNRVEKLIMMGIPFGLGAPGKFRVFIEDFRRHWGPIVQAQKEGTLDAACLPTEDQEMLQGRDIALELAWLSAILDWRAIEPADLGCQTLWLVGSKNEATMASIEEYAEKLKASKVRVEVMEGLSHSQEFTEIDRMLPLMTAFTSGG